MERVEERDSGVVVGGIWQVRIARPLTFSTSVTLIVRSGFIDIVPLSQGWPPPAGKNTESSKQIMALPLEGGGGGEEDFFFFDLASGSLKYVWATTGELVDVRKEFFWQARLPHGVENELHWVTVLMISFSASALEGWIVSEVMDFLKV